MLSRAERQAEQAASDIAAIEGARSDAQYLHEFFSRLAAETGVDYGAEIERYHNRLVELAAAKDEALARVEKAKVLRVVLSERLTIKARPTGLLKRLFSVGRLGARSAEERAVVIDGSQGSTERRSSSASDEEVVVIGSRHRKMSRSAWLSRLLIGASILFALLAGFFAFKTYSGAPANSVSSSNFGSASSRPSGEPVGFELVGKHGIVDVIVVKPGTDLRALATRLAFEYRDRSRVQVYIFDDLDSARYLDRTYNLDVSGYTQEQLSAEYAKYYPHWVATYFRDVNNRLNQVEFYKDAEHSRSETIRLPLGEGAE